jgi:hypothetical protein
MQTQNIFYVLGKIPTPDGRTVAPNLEAAKVFIDQLEMIEAKTKGNLSSKESSILQDALKSVRLTFVEASGGTPASMMPSRNPGFGDGVDFSEDDELEDEEKAPAPAPAAAKSSPGTPAKAAAPAQDKSPSKDSVILTPPENKKKFTKNYG